MTAVGVCQVSTEETWEWLMVLPMIAVGLITIQSACPDKVRSRPGSGGISREPFRLKRKCCSGTGRGRGCGTGACSSMTSGSVICQPTLLLIVCNGVRCGLTIEILPCNTLISRGCSSSAERHGKALKGVIRRSCWVTLVTLSLFSCALMA